LKEISGRADVLLEHAEPCTARRHHVYAQDPVEFDPELVASAARAADAGPPVRSGPLHDTAALAQAGIPAAMLFTSSIGGVSHARAEDTPEPDLAVAIEALERVVRSLLDR
jgi:N-carbamoyl-L-amino-acid hydrolase